MLHGELRPPPGQTSVQLPLLPRRYLYFDLNTANVQLSMHMHGESWLRLSRNHLLSHRLALFRRCHPMKKSPEFLPCAHKAKQELLHQYYYLAES